jgi:hypothetical protein
MAFALPARAVDRTFISLAGNFLDPAQWSPEGVPGEDDLAIINDGTVTLNSEVTVGRLRMSGGTLDGSGILNVTGLMEWRGGFMGGSGVTNANGGLMISTDTFLGLSNIRSLNSAGPATWFGPFNLINGTSTRLVNLPSASFSIQTSSDFSNGAFINQGTLTKTAGSGDGETRFSGALSNQGFVDVQSGVLDVSGGYAQTSSGVTRLAGGEITASTPIAINGGRVEGSGTISAAVVSAGEIRPGLPDDAIGAISIMGNYRQTTFGRYSVDIGGPTPGTDFDTLTISGAVRLDGRLAIALVDGFMPDVGDTFEVMTFASRINEFAVVTGTTIGAVGNSGRGFRPVYTDTSVSLEVIEEICDDGEDNDGDGQTDCADSKCAAATACLPPVTATATATEGTPSATETNTASVATATPTEETGSATATATGNVTEPPTATPTGAVTPPTATPTGEVTPPTATPTGVVAATATDTPTEPPTATPTGDFTPPPSSTASPSPSPTPTLTPFAGCVGDCNDNGVVTIDELIRAVSISLGLADLDTCLAADGDQDGAVEIDELVTAVNNGLSDCP